MKLKKKGLLAAGLAALIAIGGATAAHAATQVEQRTFQGVPICYVVLTEAPKVHLTGKVLKDGGIETRLTFSDGSTCLTTSMGETIQADHKSRGG